MHPLSWYAIYELDGPFDMMECNMYNGCVYSPKGRNLRSAKVDHQASQDGVLAGAEWVRANMRWTLFAWNPFDNSTFYDGLLFGLILRTLQAILGNIDIGLCVRISVLGRVRPVELFLG